MGVSILKSGLFVAVLGLSRSVVAVTSFVTTSPYVAIYCGLPGAGGPVDCGNKETNTLGYYVVTEYYGPIVSLNSAGQTVTGNGVSAIGGDICPFVTSTPEIDAGYGYISSPYAIIPSCATYIGAAASSATSVVASATSAIPTGGLSVSHVPTTSMPLFRNAAVTPGPRVAMAAAAAAGAAGVVAAFV